MPIGKFVNDPLQPADPVRQEQRTGKPARAAFLSAWCASILLTSSCVSAQTISPIETPPPNDMALPSVSVPFAAPETVAVGLAVGVAGVNLSLPDGAVATNASGRNYIVTVPQLMMMADSEGIRWYFDTATPGPVSASWSIRARLSPLTENGIAIGVNGKQYRGEIKLIIARSDTEPVLTVINNVELEDYLRGVVAREIGFVRRENYEAIKAQAVAARTYAVRNKGRRSSLGFDIFATPDDQVYDGVSAETPLTDSAVLATRGEVLTYNDELVDAFYHSTCGGHTADIRDIWGAGLPVRDRPYLRGIDDRLGEGDSAACAASKVFRWTEIYSGETLARFLYGAGATISPLSETIAITVLERDSSGRNKAIRIDRGDSITFVFGDNIRRVLRRPDGSALRSTRFDVFQETGRTGSSDAPGSSGGVIRLDGAGWGHGIGMCQMGAIGRARAGALYSDILAAYYPGTFLRKLNARSRQYP